MAKVPDSISLIVMLLFIILLFLFIQQYNELENQKTEFDNFKTETQIKISSQERELLALSELNLLLTEQLNQTTTEYSVLKQDYESLDTSYSQVKTEIDTTIDEINQYEQKLNDSMAWFSKNSFPTNIPNENRIRNTVTGRCIEITDTTCQIKLGCFYLINDKILNLNYKIDQKTSADEDHLQSLGEFMHNWGGDCEDYSLFYKAQYNLAYQYCMERADTVELEAWIPGKSEYFLDFAGDWYLNGAEPITIEGKYPNIVCGELYDPNTDTINGHCMIAFTMSKILAVSDLELLNGASLVEPQNGMYMGNIGQDVMLSPSFSESKIWMVITDNDLFLYDDGWTGYSVILDELDKNSESLIEIKRFITAAE